MSTPFPELPGLVFRPIMPQEVLAAAQQAHAAEPDGVLATQVSRLVWAFFNASAGRQGPSDLGALQTLPGQRLLHESGVRPWAASLPDVAQKDRRLSLDPDNLTTEWIELRSWFENRKDSDVAAPLVQLVAHLDREGAMPSLSLVDIQQAFQHTTARLRVGRCLIVRDNRSMREWLEACIDHGATALGVVQGFREGPSDVVNSNLEIEGVARYNADTRLSVLDFGSAEGVTRALAAFTGRPRAVFTSDAQPWSHRPPASRNCA